MTKAFLSHSSKDKLFVRKVAKELGREACVFDEQTFLTGEEFKSSIEHSLDEASLFVLFASQHALESIWVQFEIEQEWCRRINDTLKKRRALVYIIDNEIEIKDLPQWMHWALIKNEQAYRVIANDIQYHLYEIHRQGSHPYFFGRKQEIEQLEAILQPVDGSRVPRVVILKGLPGVGRRELVRNAIPKILNLGKLVEIRIGEDNSINDICISIADHVESYYSDDESFNQFTQQLRKLSDSESVQRILINLRRMVGVGELPVFLDEGGLLDSEGYIRKPIQALLRELEPNDTAYIFIISTRKPRFSRDIMTIPIISINALLTIDIMRLIAGLAGNKVNISSEQVRDLAEYVAGYPPAARFAVRQAQTDGIEAVLMNKRVLLQFRTILFSQHLAKTDLADDAKSIIRFLAAHSPLPKSVLVEALKRDAESIEDASIQLTDFALITITREGYLRIADPLFGVVERAFGLLTDQEHRILAQSLEKVLHLDSSEEQFNHPRVELYRTLFRAALLAKDKELALRTFHFANDLVILTEKFYHARRYHEAMDVGYLAIEEAPTSEKARGYLIRTLIQKEMWEEAEKMIETLASYAFRGDVKYLTGFLERKRGNISKAMRAYTESERLGKQGVAINRELAWCHYIAGDLQRADDYIQVALNDDPNNSYVIDLQAKIAIGRGDTKTAREALRRLETTSEPLFYHHRASRIAWMLKDYTQARYEAQQAMYWAGEHPPFAVFTQLVYCEIEIKSEGAEKLLDELDYKFKDTHHDIRIALRCRHEIARGRYRKALSLAETIKDKKTVSYKNIKHDALKGEINSPSLQNNIRQIYDQEISSLANDLSKARPEQFLLTGVDSYDVE